ncbi:MAG: nucleoside deaminase [Alphaproteobacteria bacterium]|nr:nucleoside deaminase [Alphaproteobacteria bacterium]TAD89310.1 MAG: nucleoside deaminase [Alphaproteobacteria bacterium]
MAATSDDDVTFMRRAIALSRTHMAAGDGGPFGAVIVLDGAIVGEGWNQVTSTNDPTAHAEVVAIREACRRLGRFSLEGATLYTSCEPCPMCLSATYWARISRIHYGNTAADAAAIGFDDAFLYREVALPLTARSVPTTQLLGSEAKAVFHEWDAKPDKVPY